MGSDDLQALLARGAQLLGLDLAPDQVALCLIYLRELKKWNRKINLTAIKDDRDSIIKHFLDSFSYVKGFEPRPGMSLLDMGSGAGFPALPLRIAFPGIRVTLVESVQKKAAFLRHIIRTLNMSAVAVRDTRIRDLPAGLDQAFDMVTARAFASMENALGEGCRFLKPGGVMVLSRGPEERVDDGAVDAAGMMSVRRIEIVLPLSDLRRALWVFGRKA